MKSIALSVLSLSMTVACTAPELELDHWGPEVDVFDDGSSLYIVGCADEALLGCNPAQAGERMHLGIGQAAFEIAPDVAPAEPVPAEALLLLFDTGPFVAMIPREAEVLHVELGGLTGEVALPASFAVEAPITASRAQPIAIDFDRPANAEQIDVIELVSCADGSKTYQAYQPEGRTFTLDTARLPAVACEHELRINARHQQLEGLAIDARRVEVVAVSTTP